MIYTIDTLPSILSLSSPSSRKDVAYEYYHSVLVENLLKQHCFHYWFVFISNILLPLNVTIEESNWIHQWKMKVTVSLFLTGTNIFCDLVVAPIRISRWRKRSGNAEILKLTGQKFSWMWQSTWHLFGGRLCKLQRGWERVPICCWFRILFHAVNGPNEPWTQNRGLRPGKTNDLS